MATVPAQISEEKSGHLDLPESGSTITTEVEIKGSMSRRKRKSIRKKMMAAAKSDSESKEGNISNVTAAVENLALGPSKEKVEQNGTEKAAGNRNKNKEVNSKTSQNSGKVKGLKINKKGKRKILKRIPAVTVTLETFPSDFVQYLKTVILDEDFVICCNRNGQRIKLGSSKYYISLMGELKRRKIPYFTYSRKKKQMIEAVIRGLPIDSNIFDIRAELINLGYSVKYVMQLTVSKPNPNKELIQPFTVKEKVPLFLVVLEKSEKSKTIYNLKQLLYYGVKVEERKKKEIPVQCRKCQRYGHTGAYCQCRLRCVKCAAEHGPKRCPVKVKSELRCANCSESHPASYHGCAVYKEYVDGMKKMKLFGSIRGVNSALSLYGLSTKLLQTN